MGEDSDEKDKPAVVVSLSIKKTGGQTKEGIEVLSELGEFATANLEKNGWEVDSVGVNHW